MIEFTIMDAADQKFSVTLNGRRVTLRLRYNPTSDRWSLDLALDDKPVLHGRRVVLGVDLIAPYNLGIGAIFAAAVTPGAQPNRTQFVNGDVRLYHATEAELALASVSS